MKLTSMNGWKDAPHLWQRYLLLPLSWDFSMREYGIYTFRLFGFVLTVDTRAQR